MNIMKLMFISVSLIMMLIASYMSVGQDNASELLSESQSLDLFPSQDLHVCSSSIMELPNGELLSYWFEGSGEFQKSLPAAGTYGADQKITNAQKLGFSADKKVILLHIDDAGMCDEANKSTEFYLGNGFVPSAAVMMPCEYAEDMVNWAKENPSKDIGIHLTLTSEWKTYRWGTVADPKQVPGLLDPDKKMWRDVESVVRNASPEEVETEIRAQIEKMIAMGHRPTHMDTHMGTLYGSPAFAKVFLDMAQEYQIPANAIDVTDPRVAGYFREAGYPITDEVIEMMKTYQLPKLDFFTSVPDGKSYEEKRDNFFKLVNSLENGLTEIIFHSSFETENLKSITGSWQQRVWEAKLFSDPEVIKFFKDKGIILTNWIEVMQMFNSRK